MIKLAFWAQNIYGALKACMHFNFLFCLLVELL